MRKHVLRRHFLIDKGFQLGLALRFFVSLLFVAILSGWAVYYAIWQTVLVEFHGMYLSRLYYVIGQRLIVYGLGAVLALSLLSIFFSHKISGPAYKMQQVINRSIEDGYPPEEIHLRRGDALQDLADALNRFFEAMRGKM